MQQFAQVSALAYEPLGIEHLGLYPEFFDLVLCLGILYHHPDPVKHLSTIHHSLVAGGRVLIDCQGIPGDDSHALMPASRYAGTKGTWWLPTLSCLTHWVKRSGFPRVRCLYAAPLATDEQRATPWAPIKSLGDFLADDDHTKTREGYPAPWRFYLEATK
jgi:tRNA (mo5U34)-methyltransferase